MKVEMTDIQQLRKGSTPLLILSVLADGPRHGYAIMRELEARSDHGLIAFVIEKPGSPAFGVVAHDAFEEDDRAILSP